MKHPLNVFIRQHDISLSGKFARQLFQKADTIAATPAYFNADAVIVAYNQVISCSIGKTVEISLYGDVVFVGLT